jgi:hypothetical protein
MPIQVLFSGNVWSLNLGKVLVACAMYLGKVLVVCAIVGAATYVVVDLLWSSWPGAYLANYTTGQPS